MGEIDDYFNGLNDENNIPPKRDFESLKEECGVDEAASEYLGKKKDDIKEGYDPLLTYISEEILDRS
jgi:hypothetical protein